MSVEEHCATLLQDLDEATMRELCNQLLRRLPKSEVSTPSSSGSSNDSASASASTANSNLASTLQNDNKDEVSTYDERKLPTLPKFSGASTKGEPTYTRWRYEVTDLQASGCSEATLRRAIQKSVFGIAAETLMYLGRQPPVNDILHKFDVLFQNSDDSEVAMSQFYSASQKADESLPAWYTRLEALLNLDCLSLSLEQKEKMLRARFWKGLHRDDVRNGLRHKFDMGATSVQLLEAARQVQEENRKSTAQSHPGQNDPTLKVLQQLQEQMNKIQLRMESLEKQGTKTYKTSTRSGKQFKGTCFKCRRSGHKAQDCHLNLNRPMSGGHLANQ
jgi:hypothetical protein